MQQVTLQPGDYVATKGMTEEQYHEVARAFMNAGAKKGEFPCRARCQSWPFFGWSAHPEGNGLFHGNGTSGGHLNGRQLTIHQVLNATDAGGKETDMQNWTPAKLFNNSDGEWGQREGDCYVTRSYKDGKLIRTVYHELSGTEKETNMHITDKLNQARDERDKAQARYEATLKEHRAAYPWLVIEERGEQPTEDMTDPSNWRAGDCLECVADRDDLTAGRFYRVIRMNHADDPVIDDDVDKEISRPACFFRFHSRL